MVLTYRPRSTLEVTRAERRVVEAFLVDGADNETIARRCGLTRDTVKTHMGTIMRRAGVSNRAALGLLIEREDIMLREVAWRARRLV